MISNVKRQFQYIKCGYVNINSGCNYYITPAMSVYKDLSSRRRTKIWKAQFMRNGVRVNVGRFATKEEAVRAVEIAKGLRQLFK